MDRKLVEVFFQVEGKEGVEAITLSDDATVSKLIEVVQTKQALELEEAEIAVFAEEADNPLARDVLLVEVENIGSFHIGHKKRRIEVAVNFNAKTERHTFGPGTPVRRVLSFALDKFKLSPEGATEYVLQVCNTQLRPEPHTHLGSLVKPPAHQICFDLVPKEVVQG